VRHITQQTHLNAAAPRDGAPGRPLVEHWTLVLCIGLALLGVTAHGIWYHKQAIPLVRSMLLLPMLGGLDGCLQHPEDTSQPDSCRGPEGSASELVLATLTQLTGVAHQQNAVTAWPLGYTLKIPLLALLEKDDNGEWRPAEKAVLRIANTVSQTDRPVLIYLFSTHFGVGGEAEKALAQDPSNLAATADGPLGVDSYYGAPIFPWSVARTDNSVTGARTMVIRALAEALCRKPASVRGRIAGVSLLGEVHHLFPRFETGMGFDLPYRASDHSPQSVQAFRRFLQQKYGTVEQLNHVMKAAVDRFSEIEPPAKDLRRDPQATKLQHLDSFATGTVPVSGWTFPRHMRTGPAVVEIFLNGRAVGLARTQLGRQDVAAAHLLLPTADVGWRYDLDFASLPDGIHRIDAFWRSADDTHRVHLGTRRVRIDHSSSKPTQAIDEVALPTSTLQDDQLIGYVDQPADGVHLIFNPLAVEWQAFRAEQVASYLSHVSGTLDDTCLRDIPRYVHQIVPAGNPSWDSGKFAVERTLPPPQPMTMGVSLYGEASYGASFSDWHKQQNIGAYAVTEFHPLRPMSSSELQQTLISHEQRGARFLSFFLEAEHRGQRLNPNQNPFALSPDNEKYGSHTTYRSLQSLLTP